MHTVELTHRDVQTAVHYPARVRVRQLGEDIGQRMEELYAALAETDLTPAGPPSITYPENLSSSTDIVIELSTPVTPTVNRRLGRVGTTAIRLLTEGGELVAYTRHHGPYTGLVEAHADLDKWVMQTGHRPLGPHRETYLVGPSQATEPDKYVTDVSVPVTAGP
jgi:effector-binding domain-containing protein